VDGGAAVCTLLSAEYPTKFRSCVSTRKCWQDSTSEGVSGLAAFRFWCIERKVTD